MYFTAEPPFVESSKAHASGLGLCEYRLDHSKIVLVGVTTECA